MMTNVGILPSGNYEVSVYLRDGSGYGRWHSLRNFIYQGDALQFAQEDCPKFTDAELNGFIKTYSPNNAYHRGGFKRYFKI